MWGFAPPSSLPRRGELGRGPLGPLPIFPTQFRRRGLGKTQPTLRKQGMSKGLSAPCSYLAAGKSEALGFQPSPHLSRVQQPRAFGPWLLNWPALWAEFENSLWLFQLSPQAGQILKGLRPLRMGQPFGLKKGEPTELQPSAHTSQGPSALERCAVTRTGGKTTICYDFNFGILVKNQVKFDEIAIILKSRDRKL